MKILSSAQIREWDKITIEREKISSIQLMERAALACFHWLESHNFLQYASPYFAVKVTIAVMASRSPGYWPTE